MYKISTEIAQKLMGTFMEDGNTFWNPIKDAKGQYWLPANEVENSNNEDLKLIKADSQNTKFDKSVFDALKIKIEYNNND